jgi:hypothetical protein
MIEESLENNVLQLMAMGFAISRQEAISRLQVRFASCSLFPISFISSSFFSYFSLISDIFAASVARALQRTIRVGPFLTLVILPGE